jgi:hypothetical protein
MKKKELKAEADQEMARAIKVKKRRVRRTRIDAN